MVAEDRSENEPNSGDYSNDTGQFSGSRSHALRGNACRAALRSLPGGRAGGTSPGARRRRRASQTAFPRRAWEQEAALRSVAGILATVSKWKPWPVLALPPSVLWNREFLAHDWPWRRTD